MTARVKLAPSDEELREIWVANGSSKRLINCLRSIAVDGTGRIILTENAKQDCGHPWTPESTFVSPALP